MRGSLSVCLSVRLSYVVSNVGVETNARASASWIYTSNYDFISFFFNKIIGDLKLQFKFWNIHSGTANYNICLLYTSDAADE